MILSLLLLLGSVPEPVSCNAPDVPDAHFVMPSHPEARDDGAGTKAQPWKTLGALARWDLQEGDTIWVEGGLYRDAIRTRVDGLVIAACPGQEVVVTGSDPLVTTWTREGDYWVADSFLPRADFLDTYDENFLVIDGDAAWPAPDRARLEVRRFTVFEDAYGIRRLAIRLEEGRTPEESEIEVGTRSVLFGPARRGPCREQPVEVPGHMLRHIRFRHAANPAQTGAVCLWGTGGLVEDVVVTGTNGRGIEVWGRAHTVRRTEASDNGHLGIGGGCTECLIEDVTADRNNWRGHDPFWEAGGGKWVFTIGTDFRRFRAHGNEGPGLWLDGESSHNTIVEADLADNRMSGLQIELGSDYNRVVNSRIGGTRRDGWTATGILIMASSHTVLEGNTVTGNEGSGLWIRVDSRQPSGGVTARNNRFGGNARAPGDHDYQARIDLDVEPGAPPPTIVWEDNYLFDTDPEHLAAMRRDREAPVTRLRTAESVDAAFGTRGSTTAVFNE